MSPPRQRFEIHIERLSHEGRGVGRIDGKTVFVADALPGERVRARYTRRHGKYDEAAVEEVIVASPERVEPPCPHALRCGGCSLQHLAPAAQLVHKQAVLLELLRHQAGIVPGTVLPPMTGPLWGYRRRARLSVRQVPKKGAVLIGFREKASHFVADIDQCKVLIPAVGQRIRELRALLQTLANAAHIPQIEVAADDAVAALVLRHVRPFEAGDLDRLRDFAARTGLRVYLQPAGPDSMHRLDGPEDDLVYRAADSVFRFRPGDFVQVNEAVNRQMVEAVLAALELTPEDRVLDLFCGLGNFSLGAARRAAEVTGMEGEAGLVARARANAAANGLRNLEFIAADLFAETGVAHIPARRYTKLLLDPPRSGAEQVLHALDLRAVERLVYVSCNPVTFARDAATLVSRHRYSLLAAGVLDMFPHTAHVEAMAVFARER